MQSISGDAAKPKAPIHTRARAISRHFWQKLLLNSLGRWAVTSGGRRWRTRFAALRSPILPPDVSTAVMAHVYYLDLLPEILDLRTVLGLSTHVHLTTPSDRADELRRLVGETQSVTVHACENRGRDIAPFLSVLQSGELDQYDAVLKVHTKRSPHLLDGEIRRKLLFAMLCGDRRATYRMLKAFEDPKVGMVGWSASFRQSAYFWMKNEVRVRELSERMNISPDDIRLGFFEGSMFWFRPSALRPLRDLGLQRADFETEAGQLDGTLHHAIERCFTIACWSRGFSVSDEKCREL